MGGGGREGVMGFSNERHLGWVKEGRGGGGGVGGSLCHLQPESPKFGALNRSGEIFFFFFQKESHQSQGTVLPMINMSCCCTENRKNVCNFIIKDECDTHIPFLLLPPMSVSRNVYVRF